MAEHNTLTGSSLHQCKQITTAGTGDAGKVITPSASTAGIGELRQLLESEISTRTYALTVPLDDLSSTSVARLVVPFAGTLTKVYTVIDQAIATTDSVLSVAIGGVACTPGTITIAFTGSAANDVDSVTITSTNTVVAGSVVTITSDGATATAADAMCTLIFTKA